MEKTLERIVKESAGLGEGLASLVLYGSAARGGHRPGQSDINLLLVAKGVDLARLRQWSGTLARWEKRDGVRVLLLTEEEVRDSVDVFPVEFGDLRSGYRVLAGRDPLSGQAPDDRHLRHQLEFELRSKALLLRRVLLHPPGGWLGGRAALKVLVRRSAGSLAHLIRALKRLPDGDTAVTARWLEELESIRSHTGTAKEQLMTRLARLHELAGEAAVLVDQSDRERGFPPTRE